MFAVACMFLAYVFIGLWSGTDITTQKNKEEIYDFVYFSWNTVCERQNGKINCNEVFTNKLQEMEKKIIENTERGVKVFSVSAHLYGWLKIECNQFNVVAFDFLWPVRWLEKSGVVGTQK